MLILLPDILEKNVNRGACIIRGLCRLLNDLKVCANIEIFTVLVSSFKSVIDFTG